MVWIISENKEEISDLMNELSFNGFTINYFTKISEAFNHLSNQLPEGIIIDADLSEISCLEFCYKIKSTSIYKKTRLIVLSSNQSESMEVSAFQAGADEFITKPIRINVLLKRLSARLNNALPDISILYKLNGKSALQIDRESFSVYLNQILVPLSRKEFELLHLMASQPGKVFTREEIFSKIWNRSHDAKERTIDVHILRLRKKIGEDFISTQKGVGYRFCA